MKLYALYDKKAEQFGPVMMGLTDGHMMRTVEETFRGSKHSVEQYPDDYSLYELGEYDQVSGALVKVATPEPRKVCEVTLFLQKAGA